MSARFVLLPLIAAYLTVAVCGTDDKLPMMEEMFQTDLEINDLLNNLTATVRVWYNQARKQARFIIVNRGSKSDVIFDYEAGQAFEIRDDEDCNAVDLNSTVANLLSNTRYPSIPPPLAVLRFTKDMKFLGRSTIRGIICSHWQGRQEIPDMAASFDIHQYWSIMDWVPAGGNPQIPVAINVTGNVAKGPSKQPFAYFITFTNFETFVEDGPDVFLTPAGTVCKGRKHTKEIPKLPNVLMLTQEIVIGGPNVDFVTYSKIWYDKEAKLSRHDHRSSEQKPPFYAFGTITTIHDFNTGVAYYIDRVLGNCTNEAIGAASFDVKRKLSETQGYYVAEMRSPKELLHIDDSYTYEGSRTARGIPTDYYISVRGDYKLPGLPEMNTTWEYFMLSPQTAQVNIGSGRIDMSQNIPMQLKINVYANGMPDVKAFATTETYNFFNFDALDSNQDADYDEPRGTVFDIRSCFLNTEQVHFSVAFIGPSFRRDLKKEISVFVEQVIVQLLVAAGGLSALRIQGPDIDYDDTHVYFAATLLERAHPRAQYVRVEGYTFMDSSQQHSVTVDNEDDCIAKCSSMNNYLCNSVSICPDSKINLKLNCVLSRKQVQTKSELLSRSSCAVFTRSVKNNRGAQITMMDAYNMISSAIEKKSLNFSVNSPKEPLQYSAVYIKRLTSRVPQQEKLVGPNVAKFDRSVNKAIADTKTTNSVASADTCAQLCLNEVDFGCESFTYCYDAGSCSLSKYSVSQDSHLVQKKNLCNLYSKNNLAQFILFPGKSIVQKSGAHGVVTESQDKCASRCLRSNGDCRSFDVCYRADGQYNCFLSKGHVSDKTGKLVISNCTHYSRDYAVDFRNSRRVTNAKFQSSYTIIEGVKESNCAKECAEKYGSTCSAYYYCMDVKSCAILTKDDKEMTNNEGSILSCTFNERVFYPNGSTFDPEKHALKNKAPIKGYSGGLLAGVGFSLWLVGLLVGILGYLAFTRLWQKRAPQSDMRIQFSKHDELQTEQT